jgi:hypothetical protein
MDKPKRVKGDVTYECQYPGNAEIVAETPLSRI